MGPATGSGEAASQDAQNRTKFERLYNQHFGDIYAFVLRRRPSQEVGDLVAEVFAVAWRRIGVVPATPEAKLWLYGVARRVLSQDERARMRRQSLFERLSQRRPAPSERMEVEDPRSARLCELLEHMRSRDREIVHLIAWESLSHEEVACVLGCSTNTVAIRWHRAIERLRQAMPVPNDRQSSEQPGRVQSEVPDGH